MAKLIVKWRYIKSGTPKHTQHLVKYIATRDGVEKCDDSWKLRPATREQTRLIGELLKDFPSLKDSHEYQDYTDSPTRFTASNLIGKGIDENVDLIGKKENYIGYIAKRPRVEKQGSHGLFSYSDEPIDLDAVTKKVSEHKDVVWTTVMSLRKEDADRLGYNNAKAWRDMLRDQNETLAKAMKIPLGDLRWYAAFHNEDGHPHVHIVSYSVGKKPYMSEAGLTRMKSEYAREIFKQDLLQIYSEETKHRDDLRELAKERIKEIVSKINSGSYDNEIVEALLLRLVDELKDYKGKMQYGYLPKSAKNLVDGIVDEMSGDERVKELYELWYEQRENVIRIYKDTMPDRLPLFENEEFKSIRNAVLKEAVNISLGIDTIEDILSDDEGEREPTEEELEDGEPSAPKNKWELYRAAKEHLDRESEEYNPKRAIELYIQSAKLGCGIAKYQLGKLFLKGEHIPKNTDYAIRWLEESADEKNSYAEYLLGKLYLKGDGTDVDTERAEELLRRSASRGNKYASYTLGKALIDGDVLEKNISGGLEFLKSSADAGFSQAEYLLGKLLYKGEVCPKDIDGAILYLERAAERGNDYAMLLLAKIYLFGKDVPKDEAKAMEYLNASLDNGNAYAESLKNSIDSNRNLSAGLGALRLFRHIGRLIQNNIAEDRKNRIGVIDRKLREKLNEKKQAQGIRIE